jgi:predicted HD phosphohydrolase
MTDAELKATTFRSLKEATAADWRHIVTALSAYATDLPSRVLGYLQLLEGDSGGFPIDRLQHSLQTATLAHRDGRDEEYVVMALLHDIGDILCTYNHADMAAAVLRPFISEENLWIVEHHNVFQSYYYYHHVGLNRDMRDQYRDHPWFQATADFVEKYDQAAFDRNYDTAPLSFFEPMVRRVLAEPRRALMCRSNVKLD